MEAKSNIPKVILKEILQQDDLPDDFESIYHTHLLCRQGFVTFKFNDELMRCQKGEFLFWFAESRISDLKFSRNFRAIVLWVEKDFLNENVPDQNWSINAILHSRTYPVKNFSNANDRQKILKNFMLLNERYQDVGNLFYNEALKLQMQLFILEMWNLFAADYEHRKSSLQTGTLYEQFMQLLQEHALTQREVQYYSNQLHITPKYLNAICKSNTGITASEWIQRYARERISILLQNKNLNISEIADEMEFSSRSFFTRYVKKLLGMTPGEYRRRMQ